MRPNYWLIYLFIWYNKSKDFKWTCPLLILVYKSYPCIKTNKSHLSYSNVVLPLEPPQSGLSIERANGHQWRDYGPKLPSLFAGHASQNRRRTLHQPERKYRSTHLRISSSLNWCLNMNCLSSVNIVGQVSIQCAIRIMPSNFLQFHVQYGCILLSKRLVHTSFILNCFF